MIPRTAIATIVLSTGATLAPGADDTRITDILPGQPILAVGAPSWSALTESMSASGFGDFWRDDEIQTLFAKILEEPKQQFDDALDELGVEPEDVQQPRGMVAGALYLTGEFDVMTPPDTQFVVLADYQDAADGLVELIERVLERGEDEGEILVREDTYEDARLWIIEPVFEDDDADDDDGEWDDEDWEDDWEEQPPFPWETVTIALADGVFVLASDTDHLERSIDALAGEDIDSIADHDVYADSLAQHPDASQGWVVFVPDALMDAFVEGMEMSMPPGVDANKMLETLGLRDLRSVSAAMRFADGGVLMEQTFAALVPEKRGLVALFDTQGGAFRPPAFVSPDAASTSRFTINFDGVLQVVRDAMAQLPEDMRAQPEALFEGMVAPIAAPVLASLGQDVWVTQYYTTPFAPDSPKNLFIATTNDEGAMSDLLVNIPGMEGREFAGGMIYSNAMGAGMGVEAPSIGLGAGHVFIGMPESIENAMRAAANPGADSLGDEPRFRKGAAMLDDRALAYMYTDIAQAYRWTKWSMDNFEQIQRAEFEAMGYEGEELEEILGWMADAKPAWADVMPSEELISEYFGDTFGQVQSTDDGFVWTSYWLRGEAD